MVLAKAEAVVSQWFCHFLGRMTVVCSLNLSLLVYNRGKHYLSSLEVKGSRGKAFDIALAHSK